jgi:hypothetical protein
VSLGCFAQIQQHNYALTDREDRARYWKTLQDADSTKHYARELASFVTAVIRTVVGHESGYTIVKTDLGKAHAAAMHSKLASGQSLSEALHDLLVALFDHDKNANARSMWDCPLSCWLAARAFRDDGRFLAPHDFTGILAKFKYIIRACAVIEAHNVMTSDGVSAIVYVPISSLLHS